MCDVAISGRQQAIYSEFLVYTKSAAAIECTIFEDP
jgi:hypothetical protein